MTDGSGRCGWLATKLDGLMLPEKVFAATVADDALPLRDGREVAKELGGRPLLRYVPVGNVHESSRDDSTFVSPTPYAMDEVCEYLALPRPDIARTHVICLDPRYLSSIAGPRWVALGDGIEYVLMHGYSEQAVMQPGWGVKIR